MRGSKGALSRAWVKWLQALRTLRGGEPKSEMNAVNEAASAKAWGKYCSTTTECGICTVKGLYVAFPCKACALAGIRHATGSTTLKRRLWHRGLAYQGQRVDMCLLDQRGLQVASRRTEHVQHGVVHGRVRRLNAKLYI